ncbi:MAG: TIGR00159 family protein [Acidobacteriaceae bacterium]|nr:TIGR00159 family protein [Acidobacteriaceae bacterium]
MASILLPLEYELPRLTWTAVLDILAVAALIYQFILIVKGRRAAHILVGVGFLAGVYLAATVFRLELLRTILATLAPYTAFALIVVFQSDIRRLLARIGRRRFLGFSVLERREVAHEILLAIKLLSQQHVGGLIVVERNIGLRTFVESGVTLDAFVSRDLLLAIFQPKNPLHDGAVIVHGDRIAAAACFLPLTTNPLLTAKLGTRHRAAIGVSEESDCVALVVSEESGRISVASGGEIELDVKPERITQILTRHSADRDVQTPYKPPADTEEILPLTTESSTGPS